MYKIYSRKRFKIPKISKKIFQTNGRKHTEKSRKILTIFLILIIAFSTTKIVLDAIIPIFDTICEDKAKSIATIISNEQAIKVIKEYTYEEIFLVEKDKEGNVTMITSNIMPINEITSNIAIKIQEEIDKKGRENIEIPLRKFYRN